MKGVEEDIEHNNSLRDESDSVAGIGSVCSVVLRKLIQAEKFMSPPNSKSIESPADLRERILGVEKCG